MSNSRRMMPMPLALMVFAGLALLSSMPLATAQNESCPAGYGACKAECTKPLYQRDPNAYPSLHMARYQFIRAYYGALRLLANCYFSAVNAVFSLLNAFRPVEHVQWANASQLLFMPGHRAAKLIRQGQLTSRQLVSAYIDRIKAVNPLINAVHLDNYDAALALADQYDSQLANMSNTDKLNLKQTKPLFGVPFTSKMNLMNQGFVISACNPFLMNGTVANTVDAPIVKRMKDAGAVLLGVTSMPNLGLSWSCDDSGCGQVNNPHDFRHMSGGSSSGEGAIIASAGSLFGIGNDIGGSVRIPSHMCGVYGLKPTHYPSHTVPVEGIVPDFVAYAPAAEQLTNGPLARYASDFPILLSVMANKNLSEYDIEVDFANNFRLFYLEDLEILISEQLHPEQRDAVRKVKKYFEQKYNLTVQKVDFPLMNRLYELWGLTGWTAGQYSLSELPSLFLETFHGPSNHTFMDLNFGVIKNFLAPKDEEESAFVAEKLAKLRHQVAELLGQDGLLLLPAWPTPPPYHNMEPFTTFNLLYTQMFNMIGNPAMTVPTGKSATNNLPLGIQLAAAPFNEALLIAAARELEKAFGGWVHPGKVPKELLMAQ